VYQIKAFGNYCMSRWRAAKERFPDLCGTAWWGATVRRDGSVASTQIPSGDPKADPVFDEVVGACICPRLCGLLFEPNRKEMTFNIPHLVCLPR
jgi:hypothetical protein